MEGCLYDDDTGQLLTGSFMDYCMPRADDLPTFKVDTRETPCTHNPLGVKGCGEAGAIGSPPAVINAITDALGVKDMPMPATPQTRLARRSRTRKQPDRRHTMYAFNYHRPVQRERRRRGARQGRRQAARRRPDPGRRR